MLRFSLVFYVYHHYQLSPPPHFFFFFLLQKRFYSTRRIIIIIIILVCIFFILLLYFINPFFSLNTLTPLAQRHYCVYEKPKLLTYCSSCKRTFKNPNLSYRAVLLFRDFFFFFFTLTLHYFSIAHRLRYKVYIMKEYSEGTCENTENKFSCINVVQNFVLIVLNCLVLSTAGYYILQ